MRSKIFILALSLCTGMVAAGSAEVDDSRIARATVPLVELEPGANELSLRLVNSGAVDIQSVRATVDPGELPEWLTVSECLQVVDVPGKRESREHLILKLEVKEGVDQATFELPVTLQDKDGHTWGFTVLLDAKPNVASSYQLSQNYPNPFNPATTIRYALIGVRAERTRLVIYNTLGQQVRTLVDKPQPAGDYIVAWDGKSDAGQQVSAGIYVYRLSSGSFLQTRKMVLVE